MRLSWMDVVCYVLFVALHKSLDGFALISGRVNYFETSKLELCGTAYKCMSPNVSALLAQTT